MDKAIRKFIKENAVDEGFLQDWYQASVDATANPVWTDEHITEVCEDFYLIPKESIKEWTLLADEKPVYYKPVLCLLENDTQVTAALDENGVDWVLYNQELLDVKVVAWKELDEVKVSNFT